MPVVAECVGFAHFRCSMYVLRVIEVRCLLDAFNVFVRLNCSRQQFSRLSRWEGDMVLNLKATIWVGRCSQLCSSITGIRVGFRWDDDGGRGGGG